MAKVCGDLWFSTLDWTKHRSQCRYNNILFGLYGGQPPEEVLERQVEFVEVVVKEYIAINKTTSCGFSTGILSSITGSTRVTVVAEFTDFDPDFDTKDNMVP